MADLPLIITADDEMLDELLRVAAAAGVEVAHSPQPGSRPAWRSARLVLIDVEQLASAVTAQLPRRGGLVAVARSDPDAAQIASCFRLGVEYTFRLGQADEDLVALLAESMAEGPGNGLVLAVIGACGGAGASVFAAVLATTAESRGQRVLLADCDLWGPGLEVVLGIEKSGGVRWSDVAASSGRLAAKALHQALPTAPIGRGRLSVLCRGDSPGEELNAAVLEVVVASTRQAGDLLVADVPRHPSPATDRMLESADLVIMVATPDVRGCYGGTRIVERLRSLGVTPELVVRGPSPTDIGAQDVAAVLGLTLVARMRPQPFLARQLDYGRNPGSDRRGPLARAAGTVLDRLARVKR